MLCDDNNESVCGIMYKLMTQFSTSIVLNVFGPSGKPLEFSMTLM
jgi:hypothetical protein